jgi:membrane fusion protein, multidrug efflux system
MTRRLLCTALGAAICTALVLSGTGCKKAAPAKGPGAVPVATTTARRTAVPYTLVANGIVSPEQTANVTSLVEGVITEIAFREGQDVVKGQKMFQIDERLYRAAYNQARATLQKDSATLLNAQREDQRYQDLVKSDYVTKEQADQQHFAYEAQKGTVAGDSAAVATAKYNLDNSTIVAPISGRTGVLYLRVVNTAHAGSTTTLTTINQIHPILVEFAVPGTALPDIRKYGASGKLPVTAYQSAVQPQTAPPSAVSVPADPSGDSAQGASVGPPGGAMTGAQQMIATPTGPGVDGSLVFVNNLIDTTTGTVLLKGEFTNKDGALWPGEFVATTLQLYLQHDALVIPEQAAMTGQQGTYVYVVDAQGIARQHRVVLDRTYGSLAVVASGIKEGDQVVTDGQSRLSPNAKVFVRTTSGTAPNTPGARSGNAGGAAPAAAPAAPPPGAAGARAASRAPPRPPSSPPARP